MHGRLLFHQGKSWPTNAGTQRRTLLRQSQCIFLLFWAVRPDGDINPEQRRKAVPMPCPQQGCAAAGLNKDPAHHFIPATALHDWTGISRLAQEPRVFGKAVPCATLLGVRPPLAWKPGIVCGFLPPWREQTFPSWAQAPVSQSPPHTQLWITDVPNTWLKILGWIVLSSGFLHLTCPKC